MTSFFSKLFGGGSKPTDETPDHGESVEYAGKTITPASQNADGQWRLAGFIELEKDGVKMRRDYMRADLFTSKSEADEFAARKGRQIIDEQGERLFANGETSGRV
jgi:hypothetical protein